MSNRIVIAAATTGALLGTAMVPAKASPEVVVGVAVKAPATAATVVGGVIGGVLLHEAFARKTVRKQWRGYEAAARYRQEVQDQKDSLVIAQRNGEEVGYFPPLFCSETGPQPDL